MFQVIKLVLILKCDKCTKIDKFRQWGNTFFQSTVNGNVIQLQKELIGITLEVKGTEELLMIRNIKCHETDPSKT